MRNLTTKGRYKRAWDIFSKYIRKKDADWKGENECYTCKKRMYWKELQAGHFKHSKLDFSELNIHPQCVYCNKWKRGNLDMYATYLVRDYGKGILEKLNQLAGREKKLSDKELDEIYFKYKEKFNNLK